MQGRLKILVACFPADGHFKPLTGIAKYLDACGHDVRWYASKEYTNDIAGLGMKHYPFRIAKDLHISYMEAHYPERAKIKNPVRKLNFDMIHVFVERGEEYMKDIDEIRQNFPPDIVICDIAFPGIPYIKDCMKLPVIAVSVFPFPGSSCDLPPYGLGLTPANTSAGKIFHKGLRWLSRKILFRKADSAMRKALEKYSIAHNNTGIFDIGYKKSDIVLQSGCPSFDYKRSDLDKRVRFIGAVLPYRKSNQVTSWFDKRLEGYKIVVLVTQGTVEKDPSKLIIPTLEAFKDDEDVLVVCTTGNANTEALRAKYNTPNIIIEDFIPFENIMPYTNVFITNGGYGGVLLGIEHKMPMVVAGVHEGKNEICARVGYFKYGINLKTERPGAARIKEAVKEIFENPVYKANVVRLAQELNSYATDALVEKYIDELINNRSPKCRQSLLPETVY